MPSPSGTCARQSSRSSARSTSRQERATSPVRDGLCSAATPIAVTRSRTVVSTPGADVHRAGRLGVRGGEEAGHDVAHVDVVARLGAVAEHGHGPALGRRAREDRDHARLAVRVLARAVDVAEPQRHRREPEQPRVERQVALRGGLGGAVGGERGERGVLGRRQRGVLAVERAAGRGEQDAPGAARPRGLQHRRGAADVHPRVERGIGDRLADVHLRREVEDDVGPLLLGDRGDVGDVRDVQRHALGHPLALAVGQVVDHRDRRALGEQRVDEVGPDEAGAAGDECLHSGGRW